MNSFLFTANLKALTITMAAVVSLCMTACCQDTYGGCHKDLKPESCAVACAPEDAEACLIWGHYSTDSKTQIEAFGKGCKYGNMGACNRFGDVSTDITAKKDAYARACSSGQYAVACYSLSQIEQNPEAKKAALEQACKGGFDLACKSKKLFVSIIFIKPFIASTIGRFHANQQS